MSDVALAAYLRHFSEVEGWCNPNIFAGVRSLWDLQQSLGVPGGVCEIGVHHGKFLLGLHNIADGQVSLAIDIFGDQALNFDRSGQGDLNIFLANAAKFARHPENIHYRVADSLALSDFDILSIRQEFGSFRLFSIDGGHTPEHTINDFRIAERMTSNGGIVFLDDFNNLHWPGVREGFSYLFLNSRPRIVPFLFCCGKLFLTALGFHKVYFEHAREVAHTFFQGADFKQVRIHGHDVMSSMI